MYWNKTSVFEHTAYKVAGEEQLSPCFQSLLLLLCIHTSHIWLLNLKSTKMRRLMIWLAKDLVPEVLVTRSEVLNGNFEGLLK